MVLGFWDRFLSKHSLPPSSNRRAGSVVLALNISTLRQFFGRLIRPESMLSGWMAGVEPAIWIANEGGVIMETEDITFSTSQDIFARFAVVFLSSASQSNHRGDDLKT